MMLMLLMKMEDDDGNSDDDNDNDDVTDTRTLTWFQIWNIVSSMLTRAEGYLSALIWHY